ncbi:MAG: ABC transporter permease [Thermodesulfobacteriota bacterium]|nr:ABC transporter permease [Thermodesulfobacteriota bacterium]
MNEAKRTKTISQTEEVWRRLKRNRTAIIGGMIVFLFVFVAILAPWISPYPPNEGDLAKRLKPPSKEHLLGTDALGRDQLSRIIFGARISLQIQVVAVFIALIIGTLLGMVGGYYGGTLDNLIMRLMDILLAFPGIFLAISIIAVLGPGLTNLMLAAGIYSIPQFARIARGSVLSLKEKEFIEAARAVGENDLNILFRYLLPNSMAPLIIQTTLRMATVLLTASGLSFLGLGVQPPTPEWGAMLSTARAYMITAPHVATVPGLAIMLVVMGFNLFGDGLRDSLDPRLRD